MARIYSPNENHNCDFGVDFFNGAAAVPNSDLKTINRFALAGYTVVLDYDELQLWDYLPKLELIKLADFLKIDSTDLTKVEIVAAIENRIANDMAMNISDVEILENIDGGTIVAPVYLDAEAVIAALPKTVECTYATDEKIDLEVTWDDTDAYEVASGSYTFTGTIIPKLPFGNANTLEATVEVVIGTVNITGVETLANIDGGTIAAPVYADAEAVIAALPKTVECTYGETGTVEADVIWADTDLYDAGVAGDYIFTGTLTLPAGYTNTDGVVATVEVTIAA
jgi:hypothetical protein